MKILALEREITGTEWENTERVLKLEAQRIFQLYLSDSLREIYFRPHAKIGTKSRIYLISNLYSMF